MKKTIIICSCIAFIVIASCTKKTTATASVSKKSSVTYITGVKEILETKCAPCHIPAKGGNKPPLDNYASASRMIDEIIRRTELAPGSRGFMPMRNPALPAEEIALLKKWKEDGLKEK
ncbi:MAG: cytochrome c [Ferruginibacter sp.]